MVASVPTLMAGRILLGAAEGPAASMSMHALYKWFPPERRALPSALQIGGAALGTLIAAPLVTWLIALAFGMVAVTIPLHYMTTAEVVPPAQRGAVFGIVAGIGTLPGLVAPFLTGHLIDTADTPAAGCTTAFLVAGAVMLMAGTCALTAIRPEQDARRLGLDVRPQPWPRRISGHRPAMHIPINRWADHADLVPLRRRLCHEILDPIKAGGAR